MLVSILSISAIFVTFLFQDARIAVADTKLQDVCCVIRACRVCVLVCSFTVFLTSRLLAAFLVSVELA